MWKLIPIWIDAGIDILWPFEVQSGMNVIKVRKELGKSFMIFGGTFLKNEVDRIMPLVEDGGYIPEFDHSVHPDIDWPTFNVYLDYLTRRMDWG